MPHQIHQRKFGRETPHRMSMLRNLTLSVLRYERVKTTEAKAKEIRRFVDRMIDLGKDGSLPARRRALAWLPEPVIVEKVFDDLAKRYSDRTSGYLRTTRIGRRVGDAAPLMLLELMPGVEETKTETEPAAAPKRRGLSLRRRSAAPAAEPEKKPTRAKAAARAAPATKRTKARAGARGGEGKA